MKKNKNWESLISIIIAVFIITIAFTALLKIAQYNKVIDYEYKKINYIDVLENNTFNIIKKINTNNIKEKQVFVIYQTWSQIITLTWSANSNYRYINHLWEYVGSWGYIWEIYSRFCIVDKDSELWQSIKCSIKEMTKK